MKLHQKASKEEFTIKLDPELSLDFGQELNTSQMHINLIPLLLESEVLQQIHIQKIMLDLDPYLHLLVELSLKDQIHQKILHYLNLEALELQELNQFILVKENSSSLKVQVVLIKIIKPLLYLLMNLVQSEQLKNHHKSKYSDLQELLDQLFTREEDHYLDLAANQKLLHTVQKQKNYSEFLDQQSKRIQKHILVLDLFSLLLVLHIQQQEDQKKLQVSLILMDLQMKHLQKQLIMELDPLSPIYNPDHQHHSNQNQLQFYLSLLDPAKKEIRKHIMDLDLLESSLALQNLYSMIILYHKRHLEFLEIRSSHSQGRIMMDSLKHLLLVYRKIRRKIISHQVEQEYSSYKILI